MTELITDAKYSHVDLTHTLSINEHIVLDHDKNLNVNDIVCDRLFYQQLLSLEDAQPQDRGFIPDESAMSRLSQPDDTHNECEGQHSITVGGFNNEVYGDASAAIGGCDNQCVGHYTTTMGVNSVAKHDNCFVWNSDKGTNVCTTNTNQLVLNPINGMHFRLPLSNTVLNEHLTNGFACFCWDPVASQMCVKTKQNDVVYKCNLHSAVNELTVQMNVVDDHIKLNLTNPDTY